MRKKKTIKIQEFQSQINQLKHGWQRTQADFENYRKKTDTERGEILKLMKADFIAKITPVLDNFRRAFKHTPNNSEWVEGIRQIQKQLEEILASEGLEKIPANPGDKFDCNLHEAISCEPNKNIPSDHIIAQVESGWQFEDKVIKPSKVRVSKGK
ncbi:MAG: nucleotide exchange factor GrpE [Patescibacteria group bacterium]